MKHFFKNRAIVGILAALLATVIVVVSLGIFISMQNKREIAEINSIYTTGVTEKTAQHFSTILEMNLSQVRSTVRSLDGEAYSNVTDLKRALEYDQDIFMFEYMALCSATGEFEMMYGDDIALVEPNLFLNSIKEGEEKIAAVTTSGGSGVVMGVPTKLPMSDGTEAIAMVAGYNVDYFIGELSLNTANTIVNTTIIRRDGSYVLRNTGEFSGNYYNKLKEQFGADGESYAAELENAVSNWSDGTGMYQFGKHDEFFSCVAIPNTEWFLVTYLPSGVLDAAVNVASRNTIIAECVGLVVILLVFIILFLIFIRTSEHQMAELTEARNAAVAANKAKSEFLSNMSHDIRTPMNAIQGMTAIAMAHIDDEEQVRSALNRISTSGHHLLGLINDVLDMSKIESGKMVLNEDRVSLNEIIENIVNITQTQVQAKNQDFDVRIGNMISSYVFCDGLRLSQVLINIISNAIKYTPEGGNIAFSMSQTKSVRGDHFVHIIIKVKDDGIGIDPDFQDQIFDSFTRVDSKRVNQTQGTGLGMAITKYIVDTMGGMIDFDSELGKGTEFRVDLDFKKMPDDDDDEETAQTDAAAEDKSLEGLKVLLAEDNEINMEVAKALLDDRGISIDWAENGQICVDMFSAKERGYYAAILMDLRMPVMNGYEAAAKIRYLDREDAHTIPIVAMSADAFAEDIRKCLEAGMDDHLSKPIEIDKLMDVLHKVIK